MFNIEIFQLILAAAVQKVITCWLKLQIIFVCNKIKIFADSFLLPLSIRMYAATCTKVFFCFVFLH